MDCNARVLIIPDGVWRGEKHLALKSRVTSPAGVQLNQNNKTLMRHRRDESWQDLVETASFLGYTECLQAEDPLFMRYTSGSTGKPKGVIHTTELKTNTKRHYRQVREEFTGTGGGAKKVKPLLDYEERLLNLLSRTSVDGTDHLMEAGIPNSPQVGILEMEMPNENYKVDENVVSVEISTKGIQRQPKLRRQIRKCKVSRLDKSLQKFEELLQNQIEVQNKVAISTDRLAAAIEALTGSISRGNLINFV
ncbi:hypothetical protein RN001_006165 [Aquatica leii]|uniref:acetate--CoA ligase n=1 Tax=Aquatica leii TaxID=1421715 RepID=A0AAN7PKU5_9COLE|nr:hypothetical protein RN001_006165 [Aquatica leii]